MGKHYLNEVGTDVILDCGVDIGDAGSTPFIYYRKPDTANTVGSWAGVLYNSYSTLAKATGTYFLKYTLEAGDLDTAGDWRFQAWVPTSTGTWYGETAKETIYDVFQ